MRQRGAKFLLFSSLILIAFFVYYSKVRFPEETTVVALVDEKRITFAQLKEFNTNIYGSYIPEKNVEALDFMISQEILLTHAYKSGIVNEKLEPLFKKQIQYAKEKIMLEMFFQIEAKSKVKITKQEINKFYENQPLFILKEIRFPFADDKALPKSQYASSELNKIHDFDTVYYTLFPRKGFMNPGAFSIVNYYDLPDYLKNFSFSLMREGTATEPIELDFAYTVFYRDQKPSFQQAKDFINKELKRLKTNEYEKKRFQEISSNNRLNLYAVDRLLMNQTIYEQNDVLVTNRLTNDSIMVNEFLERLIDLYQMDSIRDLSKNELIEYLNLLGSQKTILTLAQKNNYFQDIQFQSNFEKNRITLMKNQTQEIINYMLNDYYGKLSQGVPDDIIYNYYQLHKDNYRKSDFFKLQTVVLTDKKTADKAFEDALKNPNFSDIVTQYSNDPLSIVTLGISGFQDRTQLLESYDIIAQHQVGDIVPPIEIEESIYHVSKLLDRVQGAIIPFDEVKDQISTKVIFEMMQDYLKELTKLHRMKIKINQSNLNPQKIERNQAVYDRFFGSNGLFKN